MDAYQNALMKVVILSVAFFWNWTRRSGCEYPSGKARSKISQRTGGAADSRRYFTLGFRKLSSFTRFSGCRKNTFGRTSAVSTANASVQEKPPGSLSTEDESLPLPFAKHADVPSVVPKKTAGIPHYLETHSFSCEGSSSLPSTPEKSTPAMAPDLQAPLDNKPLLDVPLRHIGVLSCLYLLFESDRGLVIVDQHAAPERILFDS
jgi:hypothetical protein